MSSSISLFLELLCYGPHSAGSPGLLPSQQATHCWRSTRSGAVAATGWGFLVVKTDRCHSRQCIANSLHVCTHHTSLLAAALAEQQFLPEVKRLQISAQCFKFSALLISISFLKNLCDALQLDASQDHKWQTLLSLVGISGLIKVKGV